MIYDLPRLCIFDQTSRPDFFKARVLFLWVARLAKIVLDGETDLIWPLERIKLNPRNCFERYWQYCRYWHDCWYFWYARNRTYYRTYGLLDVYPEYGSSHNRSSKWDSLKLLIRKIRKKKMKNLIRKIRKHFRNWKMVGFRINYENLRISDFFPKFQKILKWKKEEI